MRVNLAGHLAGIGSWRSVEASAVAAVRCFRADVPDPSGAGSWTSRWTTARSTS